MAAILVVCTGNICRSPIAEGFLREALRGRLGDEAPSVRSAGTAGWDGSEAMPEAVQAAREHGVDVSGHRARRLAADDVREADLVLAMAGEHRDRIVGAVPQAGGRTFTMKELVALLEALPPSDDADLAGRIRAADELRASGVEPPADEDVADPIGLRVDAYRAIAWELEDLTGRLLEGLFGPAAERSTAAGEA